jgi:4-amino-4-deoxy-L-arabinose transferase-like glycosyltransferase
MGRGQFEDQTEGNQGRRLIAFIAFILILAGQILLIPSQGGKAFLWMFLLTALGIGLFIAGRIIPSKFLKRLFIDRLSFPAWSPWIGSSLILSILAALGMYLFEQNGYTNFVPVLTLWFGAMGCYLMAFVPTISFPADWKQWLKAHKRELASIAFITLLAGFLRFYKLGSLPQVVNGDEGWLGTTALSTIDYPYANPFALWENFGALYLQVTNILFGWLGVSPFSLRLLPAIGGTLAVPAIYLLAKQIVNRRVALIAAVLIAFSHTQINFSRTAAVAYIHGTWLVPLELYFLLSGLEKRRPWRVAVSGILLGIHYSVYLTAQIVTGLVLVYMLIAALMFRSQLKEILRLAPAFWAGLVIVLIPTAVHLYGHPAEFFTRLNADGTFQSGWLANTIASTGQSAVQILAGRVLHAFLSLIYYPSFDFYGSTVPMLTLFTAAMFLLGLGLSLWRTFSLGYLLLNGYFWSATLAVGIFSIPPSADTYRMLIALPAALIMAALAMDAMLTALGMSWERWRKGYVVLLGAVLASVIIFNVWVYYFDFAGHCRYGSDNPQTRFDSYLGEYLRTTPVEVPIFLLSDDTFKYGTNHTVDFLSGNRKISNFSQPAGALDLVSGDIVIANPNRIDELLTWAHAHPGGQLHQESDCQNKILLAYRLP